MMKQLEHEGTLYNIPESIWEMTLGPFLDMIDLLSKTQEDELGHQMRLVSIISGIPLETIEQMDYNHFVQLASLCEMDVTLPETVTRDEAGMKKSQEPITFEVEGETFYFLPDYAMNRMKHLSKIEDMLRRRDLHKDLHIVLAIAAYRDEHEVLEGIDLDERAALMCRAKMSEVYRPLFFFVLQGRSSTLFTRLFSRAERKAERSTRPSPIGVGTE